METNNGRSIGDLYEMSEEIYMSLRQNKQLNLSTEEIYVIAKRLAFKCEDVISFVSVGTLPTFNKITE